ncbi:hypothetical protein [Terrabacter aeriphilus]
MAEAISTTVDSMVVCAQVNQAMLVQADAVEAALLAGGAPDAPETLAAFAAFGAAWQLLALLQNDFADELHDGDSGSAPPPNNLVGIALDREADPLACSPTYRSKLAAISNYWRPLSDFTGEIGASQKEDNFSTGEHGPNHYSATVDLGQRLEQYAAAY